MRTRPTRLVLRFSLPVLFAAGLVGVAPAQDLSPSPNERVAEVEATVRELIANDSTWAGIELTSVAITDRWAGEGRDLRFVAVGGEVPQRAAFENTLAGLFRKEGYWKDWIAGHGMLVVWSDLPGDMALLEPVDPDSEQFLGLWNVLGRVQDLVEVDPFLAGDLLLRVRLLEPVDGNGRVIQFQGHVLDASHSDRLRALVDEALVADGWWRSASTGVQVSMGEVVVVRPSPEPLGRLVNIGTQAFRRGDLIQAERAFSRAIATDPQSRVLRYWKIVTLLAGGQHDRVDRLLVPLLAQDSAGQSTPDVAFALESVQGPIRASLVAHEERLLLELPVQRFLPIVPDGPPLPGITPPPASASTPVEGANDRTGG